MENKNSTHTPNLEALNKEKDNKISKYISAKTLEELHSSKVHEMFGKKMKTLDSLVSHYNALLSNLNDLKTLLDSKKEALSKFQSGSSEAKMIAAQIETIKADIASLEVGVAKAFEASIDVMEEITGYYIELKNEGLSYTDVFKAYEKLEAELKTKEEKELEDKFQKLKGGE